MLRSRRRRFALLFALVLVAELAVLCCAYGHASRHLCPGCQTCALCASMRAALHRDCAVPAVALALMALCAPSARALAGRLYLLLFTTLISCGIRMND